MARLYALVLGVAAFAALYLILHRTRLGKAMRGVAQNRDAAMMVGIDTRVVSRLAVAIGIGLSGLAGAALAPIYSVHPLMGFSFVFKAFAIIIIGGLGNVSGAAIAAVMLGVIESFVGGLLPLAMIDARGLRRDDPGPAAAAAGPVRPRRARMSAVGRVGCCWP